MSAEQAAHWLVIEHSVAELKTQLIEIKAMLCAKAVAQAPTRRQGLTIEGVMRETGHRSATAARRWLKANKVTPYAPGKWFLDAVQSAMARRSFAEIKATRRAPAATIDRAEGAA